MINYYYNRIKHLRYAQPIIKDIDLLNSLIIKFNRQRAIDVVSKLTLKYEPELQKIGIYLSGRPVIKGEKEALYNEYTEDNLMDDIDYLIMCISIIGAVRYGVEKSLEDAIENVINN